MLHWIETVYNHGKRGKKNNVQVVQSALEKGYHVDDQTHDTTLLMDAARRGDLALVKLLVSHGADPNLRDCGGWSALHYAFASARGMRLRLRANVVRVLLEAGANINASDDTGVTVLALAACESTRGEHESAAEALSILLHHPHINLRAPVRLPDWEWCGVATYRSAMAVIQAQVGLNKYRRCKQIVDINTCCTIVCTVADTRY